MEYCSRSKVDVNRIIELFLTNLVIVFFLSPSLVSAQNNFDVLYYGIDSLSYTTPRNGMVEDDLNNFYIPYSDVVNFGLLNYRDIQGGIVKLNSQGQVVTTTNIINNNLYSIIGDDIYFTGDTLVAFVNHYDLEDVNEIWAYRFNTDLETIDSLLIFNDTQFETGRIISTVKTDSSFIIMSTYIPEGSSFLVGSVFLLEVSLNMQEIQFSYTTDSLETGHCDDFVVDSDGGFTMIGNNFYYNTTGSDSSYLNPIITRFDSNMSFEESSYVEGRYLHNNYDIENYSESTYLIAGDKRGNTLGSFPFFVPYDVAVYRLDSNLNKIDSILFVTSPTMMNETDTVEVSCVNCLSVLDDFEFYYAYTMRVPIDDFQTYSWIRLVKLNDELDIIWEKNYMNSGSMHVKGIKATNDGGCIMVAECQVYYDSLGTITNMRVIKVDELGLISGINNENSVSVYPCLLYPNPANRYIIIETNLVDYSVLISNLQGDVVREWHNLNGRRIDVHGIKQGLYVYALYNEKSEFCEKGKIVIIH